MNDSAKPMPQWPSPTAKVTVAATRAMGGLWGGLRALGAIIWNDADRLNISLIAAGIGFFTTLSLFPAMAVLVMQAIRSSVNYKVVDSAQVTIS